METIKNALLTIVYYAIIAAAAAAAAWIFFGDFVTYLVK